MPEQDDSALGYALKVDEQVEKFLESKQKLVYFLVAASAGCIAFTVDFAGKNPSCAKTGWFYLASGGIWGLLCAGCALGSVYSMLKSHQYHVAFRDQKKEWDDLTESQQAAWTRANRWANGLLNAAFFLLFAELTLFVVFFIHAFATGAATASKPAP
ncbi:MAG: hypothetical protein WAO35_27535 [Terriglobia bacterium]